MSSKWRLFRATHSCKRTLILANTREHSAWWIASISRRIFSCRADMSRELLQFTLDLRYSHEKKSQGFKSGVCGGQAMPPYLLINFPGKLSLNFDTETLAVHGVAPCWKCVLLLRPGKTCNAAPNTHQSCGSIQRNSQFPPHSKNTVRLFLELRLRTIRI